MGIMQLNWNTILIPHRTGFYVVKLDALGRIIYSQPDKKFEWNAHMDSSSGLRVSPGNTLISIFKKHVNQVDNLGGGLYGMPLDLNGYPITDKTALQIVQTDFGGGSVREQHEHLVVQVSSNHVLFKDSEGHIIEYDLDSNGKIIENSKKVTTILVGGHSTNVLPTNSILHSLRGNQVFGLLPSLTNHILQIAWYTQLLGDVVTTVHGKVITFKKPNGPEVSFKIEAGKLVPISGNELSIKLINDKLKIAIDPTYKLVPAALVIDYLPENIIIMVNGVKKTVHLIWSESNGKALWKVKGNNAQQGEVDGFHHLTLERLKEAVKLMNINKDLSSYKAVDAIVKDTNHRVPGTNPATTIAKLILKYSTFTPFGKSIIVRINYKNNIFSEEITGFKSIQDEVVAVLTHMIDKNKPIVINLFPRLINILGIGVRIAWSFTETTATWKSINVPNIGGIISNFPPKIDSPTLQASVDALNIQTAGVTASGVKSEFDKDTVRSKISSVIALKEDDIVFIKRLSSTNFLVGTRHKGIFQASINAKGEIIGAPSVVTGFTHDLSNAAVFQIDSTHIIIKAASHLYKATISKTGIVSSPILVSQDAKFGTVTSIFKDSANTLLVGNAKGDLFMAFLDIDRDISVVKKLNFFAHPITHIYKPSPNTVLIAFDGSPMVCIETDRFGEFDSSSTIISLGLISFFNVTSILQVSPTHLLIASKSEHNGSYIVSDVFLDADGKPINKASNVSGMENRAVSVTHLFRISSSYVVAILSDGTARKITIGHNGQATGLSLFNFGIKQGSKIQTFIKTSPTDVYIGTSKGMKLILWERDILEGVITSIPNPKTLAFEKDTATATLTGFIEYLTADGLLTALSSAGFRINTKNTIFENSFTKSFEYKGVDYQIIWTFDQEHFTADAHVTSIAGTFDKKFTFSGNSHFATLIKYSTSKIKDSLTPIDKDNLPSGAMASGIKRVSSSIEPYSLLNGDWKVTIINKKIESWVSIGNKKYAVISDGKIITFFVSIGGEIQQP
ncbi:MAG: hypothetical protein KAG14_01295, partial [Mycoplasmataceae bacterium]|nr:hypothetical protein [Mycoplasmataceae bacterium]